MQDLPSVVILESALGRTRYRLEGGWGVMDRDWAARVRPGCVAWCEITIWGGLEQNTIYVSAFGGEVWPGAWPSLFTCHRATAQNGAPVTVTDEGRALLRTARLG